MIFCRLSLGMQQNHTYRSYPEGYRWLLGSDRQRYWNSASCHDHLPVLWDSMQGERGGCAVFLGRLVTQGVSAHALRSHAYYFCKINTRNLINQVLSDPTGPLNLRFEYAMCVSVLLWKSCTGDHELTLCILACSALKCCVFNILCAFPCFCENRVQGIMSYPCVF